MGAEWLFGSCSISKSRDSKEVSTLPQESELWTIIYAAESTQKMRNHRHPGKLSDHFNP